MPFRKSVITAITVLVCLYPAQRAEAKRKTPLLGTPPERLLELVSKQSPITVIVGVNVDGGWKAADDRLPEKAARQKAKTKEKKDKVAQAHPRAKRILERDYSSIPFFVLEVDARTLRALIDDDDVSSLEENRAATRSLAESTNIIGSDAANSLGYTGAGQNVAVLDDGVQSNHPFLLGRVDTAAAACFSGNSNSQVSLCPNGQHTQLGTGSAEPCSSTLDSCANGHGTHVAGIVAGSDDVTPLHGVAPDSYIIPIQVYSTVDPVSGSKCNHTGDNVQRPCTYAMEAEVLMGLDHVYSLITEDSYSIAAANLSLNLSDVGSSAFSSRSACDSQFPSLAAEVELLTEHGVAVVASTGNHSTTGGIYAPACLSNAISVAATSDADQLTSYSDVASFLDFLAPGGLSGSGNGIVSSVPGSAYGEKYGTSMAAPHVSGAFAILRAASPNASVATLYDDLHSTGTLISNARLSSSVPRINVSAAVALADSTAPTNPTSFAAAGNGAGSVALTWGASTDANGVDHYEISRRGRWNNVFVVVDEPAGTSFTDPGLAANSMFEYRIVAVDGHGNRSAPVYDYAVTVTFTNDPLGMTGELIRGRHVSELQAAADGWRVFAGLGRIRSTYPALTGAVYATDLAGTSSSVVDALNAARNVFLGTSFSYSGLSTPAASGLIRRGHIQQLRDAMR